MKNILYNPIYLLAAFFLFSSSAYSFDAKFGYPEINEINKFLGLQIGMEQKEFRYAIPAGWIPAESMYSAKQNRNSQGDYDEGYFFYEMFPKKERSPRFQFSFFFSKLTEADALIVFSSEIEQNATIIKLADEIEKSMIAKFGKFSQIKKFDEGGYEIEWNIDGNNIIMRAHPVNLSKGNLGSIQVVCRNLKRLKAMKDFLTVEHVEVHTNKFIALLGFRKKLTKTGTALEIALAIDTRNLSKDIAEKIATHKQLSFEKAGFETILNSITDLESDIEIFKNSLAGKRVLKTYLHFIDQDNLTNVISFTNAKGRIEDELCEHYLKSIINTGKSARCITGTELFYK